MTGLSCERPSHYLVLRPAPLIQVLSGEKKREYRGWQLASVLAGKRVALACSKSTKSAMGGKLVGEVLFGEALFEHNEDAEGYLVPYHFVEVLYATWWPQEKWLPCHGGLGLRPIPRSH